MFDIAFSEVVVIAVVALIVIGPEKLPKVARTLGLLAGRVQRYVGTVKADIEREMRVEELRKLEQEAHQIGGGIKAEVTSEVRQVDEALNTAAVDTSNPPADKPAA
ncbi:MAG: twin-arginine translocase subunit TatB [Nitrosomonadales bacterium]|nr:MAG: twin-arginine translocase subunit TatB [Nitrosomonadales bacterium]